MNIQMSPHRITPKAFTNCSPGLERSDNPGYEFQVDAKTLKGFGKWRTLSGFIQIYVDDPQGCRCAPTLGFKLANAFGVLFTKKLSEEFDLFEVACAPGANDEMQSKLQPFPWSERAFH